jgi:hypothetical protein
MLIGLVGVAIPVAIHLVGRRRARRLPFAAVDFLLGSDEKLARRLRLRELLLLMSRFLVCAAIPIALAKPYASCERQGPVVVRGPQAVALVLDNSFTSGYQTSDGSMLDRGKAQALAILRGLGPEAEVALLFTSEGAEAPAELTRDHLRVRDQIGSASPTYRPADTAVALKRATQLLTSSNRERRTIYLLAALTRAACRPGEELWSGSASIALRNVDLAEGMELENLAVTGAEGVADPNSGSRGMRVTASVRNFGRTPVRERGIAVRIDNRVVARGVLAVPAGETVQKVFSVSLPAGQRKSALIVELDADALAGDDRYYLFAELHEQVPVLLINGDPRTVRHDDELFYLQAALRPGDRAESGVAWTETTLDDLAKVDLGVFDVIVLANSRPLPPRELRRLAAWVRGGGGLLIAVGDRVDADQYNSSMIDLLPQRLSSPFDAAYGKRGAERSQHALRLAKLEHDHPIFSVFSSQAPGLRAAPFRKIMLLGPTTKVEERRVLARYDSGAAALVEGRLGDGRILLFTSTIDRDWNDLPIYPGFLPLLQQTVRYLAGRDRRGPPAEVLVGHSAPLPIQGGDLRLEVEGPEDKHFVFEAAELADRAQIRLNEVEAPGFYRLFATNKNGSVEARQEGDFAANVDRRGSDISHIDAARIASGAEPGESEAPRRMTERRVELWHAVAVALLLFMLLESVLLLRERVR